MICGDRYKTMADEEKASAIALAQRAQKELGLSKAEKDALYLEKYAKSGLGEVPWR